jgi:uncharacterized DUF497 family protein
MDMKFDFDPTKEKLNIEKHKISLLFGAEAFYDKDRLDFEDDRNDYGEERRICVAKCEVGCISVCYCIRKDAIRLISVRPASRKERKKYEDRG